MHAQFWTGKVLDFQRCFVHIFPFRKIICVDMCSQDSDSDEAEDVSNSGSSECPQLVSEVALAADQQNGNRLRGAKTLAAASDVEEDEPSQEACSSEGGVSEGGRQRQHHSNARPAHIAGAVKYDKNGLNLTLEIGICNNEEDDLLEIIAAQPIGRCLDDQRALLAACKLRTPACIRRAI